MGNGSPGVRLEDPSDGHALAVLEEELIRGSEFEPLYRMLVDAATRHPQTMDGALLAGRAAAVADLELADQQLRRDALELALEHDPSNLDVLASLCGVEREHGEWLGLAKRLERLALATADSFGRARHLAEAGDLWHGPLGLRDQALRLYRAALRAIPPWRAASDEAADALGGDEERRDRIETLLRADLRSQPTAERAADAHLALGRLLSCQEGRRNEAVDELIEAALGSDSAGTVGLGVLGSIYGLGQGWTELVFRLEAEAERVSDLDPIRAANLLAEVAHASLTEPMDLERAERALRRVVSLNPEAVDSAESLLGVYALTRENDAALLLLEDLSKVADPVEGAGYLVRAGVIHLARFADRASSLSCFERALAIDPRCVSAANHLKEAYGEAGRWADVARLMLAGQEGLDLDANVLNVRREAAVILKDKAGDLVAAADVYRSITAHDPYDDEAVAFFEQYHEQLEREAEAVDVFVAEAQATQESERFRALREAAEAAVRLGSPTRAKERFRAALEASPDDAALRDRFLDVLAQWGEFEELVRVLDEERGRLSEDDPRWQSLTLRLARAYYSGLGRIDLAMPLLKSAAVGNSEASEAARVYLDALQLGLEAAKTYEAPPVSVVPDPARSVDAAFPIEKVGDSEYTADQLAALLVEAHQAVDSEEYERALRLCDEVSAAQGASTLRGTEAREFAADLLIDHLGDQAEGLDRLAELGRDRSLPLKLRRRVNVARVRVLERELDPSPSRDLSIAQALSDAAAVAESPEAARGFRYREAKVLASRSETWRLAADILQQLLFDDPDNRAILELLHEVYEREEHWPQLCEVLGKLAELSSDEDAAEVYARLSDVAADGLADPELGVRYLRRAIERFPAHRASLVTMARLAKETGDAASRTLALRGWMAIESDHEALPSIQYALAESLESLERYEEAFSTFQRVLDDDRASAAAFAGMRRVAGAIEDPVERADALGKSAAYARTDEERADAYAAQAAVLYGPVLRDVDAAREALRAALEADESHPGALTVARRIAEGTGDSGSVAHLLRRELWTATSPDAAADRYAELGAIYAGPLDDPELSTNYFHRALETVTDHPRALSGMARILLEKDERAAAHPYLDKLAAAPDTPEPVRAWAMTRIAESLEDDGDFDAALETHRRAVVLDPDSPDAVASLARIAQRLAEDEVTVGALDMLSNLGERGVSGAPEGGALADVYARLGAVQRRLGSVLASVTAFRKALDRDAVHRDALRALSVLYEMQGEWNASATMRERAAQLLPEGPRRARALGAVAAFLRDRVGDPRRAFDAFSRAAALAPDDLSFQAALLAIATRLGRPGDAKLAALECVRLSPNDRAAAEYLTAAADCAEAEGKIGEAIDLARAALERDPACPPAMERVIPSMERAGDSAAAAELLARAVEKTDDDELAQTWRLERVRLLLDIGAKDDAADAVARAVANAPDDAALLTTLVDGPPPPPAAARAALDPVAAGLVRDPVDVPRLLAVESLAYGAGEVDRAYLAGSILDLMRVAPMVVVERVAEARAHLTDTPSGKLDRTASTALVPGELRNGEAFCAEVEALELDAAESAFAWFDGETTDPEPEWSSELERTAEALLLPRMTLRVGAPGSGVRVVPAPGHLVLDAAFLSGRLPGEVRFALGFGLTMCVPGRRWATASGDAEQVVARYFRWAKGGEDADLDGRFRSEVRSRLATSAAGLDLVAADFLDAGVVLAARNGLVAAGDLVQGLAAAFRILAPDHSLPRSTAALDDAAAAHPALHALLGFLHSDPFRRSRELVGTAVTS